MICEYKKFVLDEVAREYFIKTLDYGHELDRQLLKNVNFFNGYIYTYLPQEPSFFDSYQFEGGGVAKSSKSLDCIISEIFEFIIQKDEKICIIEDALCTLDDSFSSESKEVLLNYNSEVYFCVDKNIGIKSLRSILVEAEQPNFFVCVLSSKPSNDFNTSNNRSLSLGEIKSITENSEKIILGAYDGEGYLIWDKGKRR